MCGNGVSMSIPVLMKSTQRKNEERCAEVPGTAPPCFAVVMLAAEVNQASEMQTWAFDWCCQAHLHPQNPEPSAEASDFVCEVVCRIGRVVSLSVFRPSRSRRRRRRRWTSCVRRRAIGWRRWLETARGSTASASTTSSGSASSGRPPGRKTWRSSTTTEVNRRATSSWNVR